MIPAVILAAGKSTRMGQPKALLALPGGDTFLTRIIRTFEDAGVDDVVVVIGHEAEAIAASVAERGLAPRIVVNRQYESGQFSSFLAGLRAIDRPGVQALLLTLVDVPLVSSTTVRAVIDRYRANHAPIVRPVSSVRSDLHGHPVLMDRTLFDALRATDPSNGAKPIVRAHASPAGDVISDDEGAFLDIDTPEDYERARRGSRG
jgi:molybdenum cofactor cytidylyltransferase